MNGPFITERDRRNLLAPTVEQQKRRISRAEDLVREVEPTIVPERHEVKHAFADDDEDEPGIFEVETRNRKGEVRYGHRTSYQLAQAGAAERATAKIFDTVVFAGLLAAGVALTGLVGAGLAAFGVAGISVALASKIAIPLFFAHMSARAWHAHLDLKPFGGHFKKILWLAKYAPLVPLYFFAPPAAIALGAPFYAGYIAAAAAWVMTANTPTYFGNWFTNKNISKTTVVDRVY